MVSELCQPEAMFVDEIDGEDVATGRNRPGYRCIELAALARARFDWRPNSVPVNGIAALVEPVVREVELAPRGCACVLERHTELRQRPGLDRRNVDGEPAHGERTRRNLVLQGRASLGRWNHCSYERVGVNRSNARPCGSCVRRGVRCPPIARCESAMGSSTSCASPSSARK